MLRLAFEAGVALRKMDLQTVIRSRAQIDDLIDELGDEYTEQGGFIYPTRFPRLLEEAKRREGVSINKLNLASSLVSSHRNLFRRVKIAAASGSISYRSSEPDDDIDLLLVFEDGHMWSELLKILMFIRVNKLINMVKDGGQEYCLSVLFTEGEFLKTVERSRDPLLARDLFKLVPLKGAKTLSSYQSRCKWVTDYFPGIRIGAGSRPSQRMFVEANTRLEHMGLVEVLSYRVLSAYLGFVANLRNRLYRREGLFDRVFEFRHSPSFMTYESNRYKALRLRYAESFNGNDDLAAYKSEYRNAISE